MVAPRDAFRLESAFPANGATADNAAVLATGEGASARCRSGRPGGLTGSRRRPYLNLAPVILPAPIVARLRRWRWSPARPGQRDTLSIDSMPTR